jgi:hypothetical protein
MVPPIPTKRFKILLKSARPFDLELDTTYKLTEFIHLCFKTFLISARLTLIPSFLVHDTRSISLACVDSIPAHASHEEATASIASVHTIMPA